MSLKLSVAGFKLYLSLKLSVGVLSLSGPSLTDTDDAVLLSRMRSDDTRPEMWFCIGLTSKARGPIYSNLRRDFNGASE